jgi:hypothetical protein
MLWRRTFVAVVLLAFCVACSGSSEKLTKDIQEANSWIASARLVAKSYSDGAVPKAYAHDALESFNQQLQSTAKRVQSTSEPRAAQTAAALQRAQRAIAQIDASIDQGDQLSIAQFDSQLDNEQKQLTTLANPQSRPEL